MSLIVGQEYSGFELKEIAEVKEIGSTAYQFIHKKSGAKLLFMENEDDNKVFSITFRTPPNDSTGVPHIVEHSVLCGSRKFPMKEPFVELVKGSLNTYLNAMTFSDKTMYPVASRNDKDFQNLMDVYLDAVFYPVMYDCPEVFMQEGWHYEAESKDSELRYKGVVYNEMKGAFSSPEAILDKEILASLFPDTTYGYESGGDPDVIPELTLEGFLAFHQKYYHPSNSYIYLYGKMDIVEKLSFLDKEYLSAFEAKSIDSTIEEQKLFSEPKYVESYYPASANEDIREKTFLSLNCIVGKAEETETMMALQILEHFLLRTQSAPLKKALIDANIGKDVLSSFADSILQPSFSIIVSGSDVDQVEAFKRVTKETLEKLVREGIDRELIEASINLLEFKLREADFGQSPKGLIYNIKCMDSWLYDANPLLGISYEKPLEHIKSALDNRYFEKLIETRFLNNSHMTLVVLKPKQGLGELRAKEIRTELAAHKAKLSETEIENYIEMTKKLQLRQETPDTPDALATIPLLKLQDIEPKSEQLILEEKNILNTQVLFHPIPTNKIAYLNLYFDAATLPQDLVLYAYLLAELLGKVSTENYEYSSLANEVNSSTGGIAYDVIAFTESHSAEVYYPKFKVKAKALVKKLPNLMKLLSEVLTKSKFDDKKRVKELIAQLKSSLEMYLLRNAQQVVAGRVLSYFSPASRYNEQGLLSFYEFIVDLNKNFESRYAVIQENFAKIMPMLFNKNEMVTSITLDKSDYDIFAKEYPKFLNVLHDIKFTKQEYEFTIDKLNEGLMTSSKIQYVAKGANFNRLGFAFSGSLRVLETILRYDYLWNRIRVQGGAYGAFTQFRRTGNMVFGSYRDPNLAETIDVYNETANYMRNFTVDEREMTKYIIGSMSTLDTPLTPQMKGEVAAECHIRHITQADIQRERDQVLATKQEDIRSLANLIDACMKENYLCVLGGEEKIKENKEIFNSLKQVFN
ncbi:insulinase family protein [Anaerosinus sp.]|uniref:insulinase family protein n=1 Tax=Selenobaculum sp. TaxID=3074374 RepID=UPI003AB44B33